MQTERASAFVLGQTVS